MNEKDILQRVIPNDALFANIHVFQQRFDIIPREKDHIGAFIEYQDIQDRSNEFLNELIDSIVDWVYSKDKAEKLAIEFSKKGKSVTASYSEVFRKAKNKFRKPSSGDALVAQGQFGELLLFHFIQRCLKAVPLLRKMPIATDNKHERFGADAIHYKVEGNKNIIILGEAKAYTSDYKFSAAFEDALTSILNTYNNHREELELYLHEDFLDDELNQIAEEYLSNRLPECEIHLVSIVAYQESKNVKCTNQCDIQNQIQHIIEERYKSFDQAKIDIDKYPILKRITYIVFPIWEMEDLIRKFQECLL